MPTDAIDILIVYHSQSGHTARMAQAVAEGVESVEGARAVLKRANEATLQDLIDCRGLALGTPEYFGYMSGLVKDFLDRTYVEGREHPAIFKKPYATFISAGNDGEGALRSIERIMIGYQLRKVFEPVIARGEVSEKDLEACRELGATLAAGCDLGIY